MLASQKVWYNTNSTTSGMRRQALRQGQIISSSVSWQVESTCLILDTRHSAIAKYFPGGDPENVSVEANSIVDIMILLALKKYKENSAYKDNLIGQPTLGVLPL